MAFNIKKRQPAPEQPESSNSEVSCGCGKGKNVVATQKWVWGVLDKIFGWMSFFRTGRLQVMGPIESQSINCCQANTRELIASKMVLFDNKGKKMYIYINDKGQLATEYEFENAFVYPVTGIGTREYLYKAGSIRDNFEGLSPTQLAERFIKFHDVESVTVEDDKICYKLCSTNGEDTLVRHSMLFTCNQTKVMTSVSICDENLNEIKRIKLPKDIYVRQLTINLPYFSDERGDRYLDLPCNIGSSGCGCGCGCGTSPESYIQMMPPPFAPIMPPIASPLGSSINLSSSLFDDAKLEEGKIDDSGLDNNGFDLESNVPPSNCECEMDQLFGMGATPQGIANQKSDNADLFNGASAISQSSFDFGEDEEVIDLGDGMKLGDYVANTYSNIVLKHNDFEQNKMQFLVVNLKDAGGDDPFGDEWSWSFDKNCPDDFKRLMKVNNPQPRFEADISRPEYGTWGGVDVWRNYKKDGYLNYVNYGKSTDTELVFKYCTYIDGQIYEDDEHCFFAKATKN